MICGVCGSERPVGDEYCGKCGAVLSPDASRLREQVVAVVRETVKDGDVLAGEIAGKVEDQLWRWAKVLSICGVLLSLCGMAFVGALGLFGVRSYETAKGQIDAAGSAAAQSIRDAGQRNAADLNTQARVLLSQLEGQATPAEAQLRGLSAREQAASLKVQRLEAAFGQDNQRLAALQRLQHSAPLTPIGNISSDLTTPYNPASPLAGSVLAVYELGSTGPQIAALQSQLTDLGCYSGTADGQFDDATERAVVAFQTAYSNSRSSLMLTSALLAGDDFADYHNLAAALYAPEGPDGVGVVGWETWNHLFAASPVHCK